MRSWFKWGLIVLTGCLSGCSSTGRSDFLLREYPHVEREIEVWIDSLSAVCARLDVEELADYHAYNDKFTRIDNAPNRGAIRFGQVEGKKIEDDYFSMLSQFDATFTDLKIDVLGERQAIVTMKYKFQGFVDGKALHDPIESWASFVLVKPDEKWKILFENLVIAEQ